LESNAGTGKAANSSFLVPMVKELNMPVGSKAKYSSKQKRKAAHIEESYEDKGLSEGEAERRAWATVNKQSGGGEKGGSASTKSAKSKAAARSASAKKAAATRKKNAGSGSKRKSSK
jgi:hypothetical protein